MIFQGLFLERKPCYPAKGQSLEVPIGDTAPLTLCIYSTLEPMEEVMKRTLTPLALLATLLFILTPGTGCQAGTYESFYPCFKELSGWQADKPQGMDASMGGMRMLSAFREYKQGEKEMTVSLNTGQMAAAQSAQVRPGTRIDTPEMRMEVKKIKGRTVSLMENKGENSSSLMVILGDPGPRMATLVFAAEHVGIDELLDLAKGFDWACFKKKAEAAGK